MNEAVKLTQPPSRPAWGWPPKAFSTCRPASASFVRRFWPQATHQARNLQKGCMMLYDFYDFYVLDRNHSTGCGCKSCLAFFGVPNDSFCPERLAESEITDAFLRITTESSNNLILCSKTTEPQAVRSLKRWNLTMQGMSDLLHGLPASRCVSSLVISRGGFTGTKKLAVCTAFQAYQSACGIPALNKQTRTSQRRQILPSLPHCCQIGKSGTPHARRNCAHCDQWNVIFCWPSCLRYWRVLQILSSEH